MIQIGDRVFRKGEEHIIENRMTVISINLEGSYLCQKENGEVELFRERLIEKSRLKRRGEERVTTFKVSAEQHKKYLALGGNGWLRRAIDEARLEENQIGQTVREIWSNSQEPKSKRPGRKSRKPTESS